MEARHQVGIRNRGGEPRRLLKYLALRLDPILDIPTTIATLGYNELKFLWIDIFDKSNNRDVVLFWKQVSFWKHGLSLAHLNYYQPV